MNTIFIGIAGGTGSGKTTLTEHLKQHFGDDISVVHHDSYYKYQDRPFEERCKQNYDHKGDGCQNDGKSGLPGIVFSAVIRRRRVLPLGGLLRGLPLSVLLLGVLPLGGLLLDGLRLGFLLLGLLDGLLRLLPLRGLLGLLLFCSAIGAEFHGFRDFFAAVVTIHVPLSFIFKIYDNYNFDRAI